MAYIKGDGVMADGKQHGGGAGSWNKNCEAQLSVNSWFTGCFLVTIGGFASDNSAQFDGMPSYPGKNLNPAVAIYDELVAGVKPPDSKREVYATCFLATLNAKTHSKAIEGLKTLGWKEIFRAPGSHCEYSTYQSSYKNVPYYEMVILVCLCPPDFHLQGWKFLQDKIPASTGGTREREPSLPRPSSSRVR